MSINRIKWTCGSCRAALVSAGVQALFVKRFVASRLNQ